MEVSLSDLQPVVQQQSQTSKSSQEEVSLDQLQPPPQSDSDLSQVPALPDVFNGESGNEQNQTQNQGQPQDPLNIGDHAALSFLNNPQDQQNYLKSKYPYVIPDGKGNYMVGQSPNSVVPVNPQSSGQGFFSWLASQANQIAPTAGMMIGAAEGPLGAAAGAAAGEAINKTIGASLGANESPQKMAIDTAISGAFGGIGQKAAEMFGLAAGKIVAPPLAKMVDGKLNQIVQNGGDPSKFINFVSKAVHFASGADAEDVKTLMQYGVNKSLSDPSVNNKNAIINIAQDIMEATQAKRTQLGEAVGASGRSLIQKSGNATIQTSPILNYLKSEITNRQLGTVAEDGTISLYRDPHSPTDTNKLSDLLKQLGAQPVIGKNQNPLFSPILRTANSLGKQFSYDITNPADQAQIEKLFPQQFSKGSIQNELDKFESSKQDIGSRSFKLPAEQSIPLTKAINIRNTAGKMANKDESPLSDDMRRIFRNVIFDDKIGVSSQLSKVASEKGVSDYVANNMAYKNFMQSVEKVQQNGFDPYEPKSIQDYGKHINDRPPIDNQTLNNFEKNIGSPVLDNLKRYSAIQKLSNYNPNFLRLGLISGALGGMLGDGDFEGRLARGAGFALGIPLALKTTLRATELPQMAGSAILRGLVKSAPAIASQKGASLLQTLVHNKNKNNS